MTDRGETIWNPDAIVEQTEGRFVAACSRSEAGDAQEAVRLPWARNFCSKARLSTKKSNGSGWPCHAAEPNLKRIAVDAAMADLQARRS